MQSKKTKTNDVLNLKSLYYTGIFFVRVHGIAPTERSIFIVAHSLKIGAIALCLYKKNTEKQVSVNKYIPPSVRVHGIGPWTSVLSGQRSTTELYTHTRNNVFVWKRADLSTFFYNRTASAAAICRWRQIGSGPAGPEHTYTFAMLRRCKHALAEEHYSRF